MPLPCLRPSFHSPSYLSHLSPSARWRCPCHEDGHSWAHRPWTHLRTCPCPDRPPCPHFCNLLVLFCNWPSPPVSCKSCRTPSHDASHIAPTSTSLWKPKRSQRIVQSLWWGCYAKQTADSISNCLSFKTTLLWTRSSCRRNSRHPNSCEVLWWCEGLCVCSRTWPCSSRLCSTSSASGPKRNSRGCEHLRPRLFGPTTCVSQLKTVDGRDEVSQGFSGVGALFTSRPETGPKHRRFARSEHVIKEDVLPLLQSEASPFWPCRTMVSTSACSRCFWYKTSRGLLPKVSSSLLHSSHSCRGSSPTIPTGKAQEKAEWKMKNGWTSLLPCVSVSKAAPLDKTGHEAGLLYGQTPRQSTLHVTYLLAWHLMWMLYALELVLFIIYNDQKQQTCQGYLGISWDLHATADLWACSANKTAGCRDVKCVSHFTIVKRSHTVEGPSHAWCESSCQPISNYCVGGSTITVLLATRVRITVLFCLLSGAAYTVHFVPRVSEIGM